MTESAIQMLCTDLMISSDDVFFLSLSVFSFCIFSPFFSKKPILFALAWKMKSEEVGVITRSEFHIDVNL